MYWKKQYSDPYITYFSMWLKYYVCKQYAMSEESPKRNTLSNHANEAWGFPMVKHIYLMCAEYLLISHVCTQRQLCIHSVWKYPKWVSSSRFSNVLWYIQFVRVRNYNSGFTIGWLTSNVRVLSKCFHLPSPYFFFFSFVELKAHENWSRFVCIISQLEKKD